MTRVEELAQIARLSTPLLGDLKALDAAISEAIRKALTEAMGEPTPEMVESGEEELRDDRANSYIAAFDEVRAIWTAMAAVRLRDVLSGARE